MKNVHFHANSTSGKTTKGKSNLKHETIKPTGKKTANFTIHENGYDASVQMVAKGSNERSFKLVPTYKSKVIYEGHHITLKSG